MLILTSFSDSWKVKTMMSENLDVISWGIWGARQRLWFSWTPQWPAYQCGYCGRRSARENCDAEAAPYLIQALHHRIPGWNVLRQKLWGELRPRAVDALLAWLHWRPIVLYTVIKALAISRMTGVALYYFDLAGQFLICDFRCPGHWKSGSPPGSYGVWASENSRGDRLFLFGCFPMIIPKCYAAHPSGRETATQGSGPTFAKVIVFLKMMSSRMWLWPGDIGERAQLCLRCRPVSANNEHSAEKFAPTNIRDLTETIKSYGKFEIRNSKFAICRDLFADQYEFDSKDFTLIRDVVWKKSGIYFEVSKQRYFCRRLLRRMELLGCQSVVDYYHILSADSSKGELAELLNLLTTTETYFSGINSNYNHLKTRSFPSSWKRNKSGLSHLHLWSAGCSSGEEPYTLAMILLETIPNIHQWKISLVGTDINTQVITKARQGSIRRDLWEIPRISIKPNIFRKWGTNIRSRIASSTWSVFEQAISWISMTR